MIGSRDFIQGILLKEDFGENIYHAEQLDIVQEPNSANRLYFS